MKRKLLIYLVPLLLTLSPMAVNAEDISGDAPPPSQIQAEEEAPTTETPPQSEEEEKENENVYLYTKVEADEDILKTLTLNGDGWYTIGQISVKITDPDNGSSSYVTSGDDWDTVMAAVASAQRYAKNSGIDLADIDWSAFGLKTDDGACDFISNGRQWHLDGKITIKTVIPIEPTDPSEPSESEPEQSKYTNVIIKYLDADTGEIIKTDNSSLIKVGTEIDASSYKEDIDGYSFKNVDPDKVTAEEGKTCEITIYYTKNSIVPDPDPEPTPEPEPVNPDPTPIPDPSESEPDVEPVDSEPDPSESEPEVIPTPSEPSESEVEPAPTPSEPTESEESNEPEIKLIPEESSESVKPSKEEENNNNESSSEINNNNNTPEVTPSTSPKEKNNNENISKKEKSNTSKKSNNTENTTETSKKSHHSSNSTTENTQTEVANTSSTLVAIPIKQSTTIVKQPTNNILSATPIKEEDTAQAEVKAEPVETPLAETELPIVDTEKEEENAQMVSVEDTDTPLSNILFGEDGCIIHLIMLFCEAIYFFYLMIAYLTYKEDTEDENNN